MNSNRLNTFTHCPSTNIAQRLLSALPILTAVVVYFVFSHLRLSENPYDKLLPSLAMMLDSLRQLMFEPDLRSGHYVFWLDTITSLLRLLVGVFCSALTALLVGIPCGLYQPVNRILGGFLRGWAMIPPLAIMPIILIVFGIDEGGKLAVLCLGLSPLLARDVIFAVMAQPKELAITAISLRLSHGQYIRRVVLPLLMPRFINAIRLSLGAGWLFLLAAEAISSNSGLGYRIFKMRNYMDMSIIIPYTIWLTLLGFWLDGALKRLSSHWFRWQQTA